MVVDLCDDDVDSHSADVDLLQNQLEGIMMELSELPSPTLAHAALLVRGYSGHESARIYKVYVYIYTHRYRYTSIHVEAWSRHGAIPQICLK